MSVVADIFCYILGMPFTRAQKQKILENLEEKIARKKAIIFVDFTGLKFKDLSDLRKKLKAADNELMVAKKTLIGIAFKKAGLKIETKELKGEIALVFGFKNEISPAKIVWLFSQINPNLKILGGTIESQKYEFLNAEQVIELAKLPTKEELLARFIGSIKAPVSNFVYALEYNLKGLMFLLNKIKGQ